MACFSGIFNITICPHIKVNGLLERPCSYKPKYDVTQCCLKITKICYQLDEEGGTGHQELQEDIQLFYSA